MVPVAEAPDCEFDAICGTQFASGMHRTVHNVIGHPDVVMKVAIDATSANWHEYFISCALSERAGRVAEIVGSVKSISATGKYLIMERLPDCDSAATDIFYPIWATDLKRSAFGKSATGSVQLRDFGTTKIGSVLGQQRYIFDEDRSPAAARVVADGHDDDYAALQGQQIGTERGRNIYEVKSHPHHVLKMCIDSHLKNQAELLVYGALSEIDADILPHFGIAECSRSGKYLIMERLSNLPVGWTGHRLQFPKWLSDKSDACLGLSVSGEVKIRTYNSLDIGDALVRAAVLRLA